MKEVLTSLIISAEEKASARPATPLFQVQPSGWPSISHNRMGLPALAASWRASQRSMRQAIVAQRSSLASGLMRSRRVLTCLAGTGSAAKSPVEQRRTADSESRQRMRPPLGGGDLLKVYRPRRGLSIVTSPA